LGDNDSNVRSKAAESLGKLGNSNPEVVFALIKSLGDKDTYVRREAAESLGKLGNSNPEVVFALIKSLGDKDTDVRIKAAESLGKLGFFLPTVSYWFQYQPPFKMITLSHCCLNYLKLAFAETKGKLKIIQLTSQPLFDCCPLSNVSPQFTWNWIEPNSFVLDCNQEDQIEIIKLLEYLFKDLQITIQGEGTLISHFHPSTMKDVEQIMESLKVWISFQTKESLILPLNNNKSSAIIELPITNTSLSQQNPKGVFGSNEAYLSIFQKYFKPLWESVDKKSKKKFPTLVEDFISIKTSLHKLILIEVLEYIKTKVNSDEPTIQVLESKIALCETFHILPKKPKSWSSLIPSLIKYQSFLKHTTNYVDHDLCVILWAACSLSEDKSFFKGLNEVKLFEITKCHVFDPQLSVLSPLLSGLKSKIKSHCKYFGKTY